MNSEHSVMMCMCRSSKIQVVQNVDARSVNLNEFKLYVKLSHMHMDSIIFNFLVKVTKIILFQM